MKSQVVVKKFLSLAHATCVVFLAVSPAKFQAMPFKVEAHSAATPAITTFNLGELCNGNKLPALSSWVILTESGLVN